MVNVGCQKFAIEDKKKLVELLDKYLEDPREVEDNWMKNNKL